jgi:peptide deformylase
MPLLKLITVPDPRLKKHTAPVLEVNDEVRSILKDMYDTMKHQLRKE